MIGIYKVTNLINGKSYIGQSKNLQRRRWEHNCLTHTNPRIRPDMELYGKENFAFEVLEECGIDELDERERYYITTLRPEYNTFYNNDEGEKFSPELRERISASVKKVWVEMDDEHKGKIIENLVGPKKGHLVSEETREKLRNANLGKTQSVETREKRIRSFALKRKNGWVKDGSAHWKKVLCVETGVVYDSVKKAGECIGINPSSISAVLKKKYKHAHGYHFEYWKV